jgi:predicted phage terminase large subunit-like protein
MNESKTNEKSTPEKRRFLASLERLFLEGFTPFQIADELGEDRRIVSRNLREIKKRWARAAARQNAVLNQTQCATVYREAMDGWQRSQNPKTTTTEENKTGDKSGESDCTVTRSEQGPGDKTFLATAVGALKALRRFAAEPKAAPASGAARSVANALLVDLLQIMTQEQANELSHEQVHSFRQAIDARRRELRQRRLQAEARRDDAADGNGDPAGLHGILQAGLPAELAPRDAGENAGPGGGGSVPPADGLHAAATRQERAGEPPLSGLHAGQQPEPAADRGQDPAEASAADWPAELFGPDIWCSRDKWPAEFKYRVVCLDASKGRSDRPGDYSAIVFVGVHQNGLLYVDAIVEHIPLAQVVRRAIAFCDQYRPDLVGIEAEQFQELLVHEFNRQCNDFRRRWSVWMMATGSVPKVARIRRLTHYISGREFRFKADSPGCRRLVDQLMDFPLAEHDDGPDALEMCTRLPVEVKRLR